MPEDFKSEPLQQYFFNSHSSLEDTLQTKQFNVTEIIAAKCIDVRNRVIVDAVIDCAKTNGVTQLCLFDTQFVLDAILEAQVKKMRDDEYAKKLNEIEDGEGDEEIHHVLADGLICELLKKLGYVKTIEAYDKIDKWYA